jgi:hypothetical protein
MLHRLCGPPSIPLSFTVAGVLPRWYAYRVNSSTEHALRRAQHLAYIVYSVDYQGI